jgi:hypothetical protein
MSYNDGSGQCTLPRTGRLHQVHNKCAVMNEDHIGINNQFTMTASLNQIFSNGKDIINQYIPPLLNEIREYRDNLAIKSKKSNEILSDGFWYYVFNNHKITRVNLKFYLENEEKNPVLNNFFSEHEAGLDFLYLRVAFVNMNKFAKQWFVFWDDFYAQNKDMSVVEPLADKFNPSLSTALCYHPMERKDLEVYLKSLGLWETSSKIYFNDSIMNSLYNSKYLTGIDLITDPTAKLNVVHPI